MNSTQKSSTTLSDCGACYLFLSRPKCGYHAFPIVGLFVRGALAKKAPVPLVASLNNMDAILDAGGEERSVSMQTYDDAQMNGEGIGEHWRTCDPETTVFTPTVSRHIEYITHDAGRQMIGSFHPTDGDFFEDAYKTAAVEAK